MTEKLRLGVNVDHVATLRNARGGIHPDPVEAAKLAVASGADGITAHLREDRRHIRDVDLERIKHEVDAPLNFEMAATDEMVAMACEILPNACCLVPEKRQELTTEGGLSVAGAHNQLAPNIAKIQDQGIRVSLFIDPVADEIKAAREIGADIIELHAGPYTEAKGDQRAFELDRLIAGAKLAEQLGLECHAGHGLNYETVSDVAAIANIVELNIGHFLVGEAIFVGFEQSIRKMRDLMDAAREGM